MDFLDPPPNIIIQPMQPGDVAEVVRVHLASFPGFFLTFLGNDFLPLLYKSIQSDPIGYVLVASCNGQIQGFVAGVAQQSGFYRRLIEKHKWKFVFASAWPVVKKPHIAPKLLMALHKPADVRDAAANVCLMSIAVRPEAEGQGIGRQLFTAFDREFSAFGVPAICLTTGRDANERANRFYQRLGFELTRCFFTHEGRALNEYVIQDSGTKLIFESRADNGWLH